MSPVPSVGRAVHYMSRGSADGVFLPACRAAEITEIDRDGNVGLFVKNPDGLFLHSLGHPSGPVPHNEETKAGGTWHWPERVGE